MNLPPHFYLLEMVIAIAVFEENILGGGNLRLNFALNDTKKYLELMLLYSVKDLKVSTTISFFRKILFENLDVFNH